MAMKDIERLVAKLESISRQISEKQSELSKLKEEHLAFWEAFQKECHGTGHSLTLEEREALYSNKKIDISTTLGFRIHHWLVHGYMCPYCLENSKKIRWGEVIPGLDLCKRKSFENWIGFKVDEWPSEKATTLVSAKKEVEDYFSKAESLEQEIEVLKKADEEIRNYLENIWKLLDVFLGHEKERKQKIQHIHNSHKSWDYEYEERRDRYYPD